MGPGPTSIHSTPDPTDHETKQKTELHSFLPFPPSHLHHTATKTITTATTTQTASTISSSPLSPSPPLISIIAAAIMLPHQRNKVDISVASLPPLPSSLALPRPPSLSLPPPQKGLPVDNGVMILVLAVSKRRGAKAIPAVRKAPIQERYPQKQAQSLSSFPHYTVPCAHRPTHIVY